MAVEVNNIERLENGQNLAWKKGMFKRRFLVLASLAIVSFPNAALPCGRPPGVSISNTSPNIVFQPGDEIVVQGQDFDRLRSDARLTFTSRLGSGFGHGGVPIRVMSPTELRAIVPSFAKSGEVKVTEAVSCSGPVAGSYSAIRYTLAQGPHIDVDNKLPYAPFGRQGAVVSDSAIDLSWSVGNPVGRNGFVVNTSEDNGRSYRRFATVYDPVGQSVRLQGLKPGTTYFVDIAAFGPAGETFTQPGDILVFTTGGVKPGAGKVTFATHPGIFCRANIEASRVEAIFDQDADGVVNLAPGSRTKGSYPHHLEYRIVENSLDPPVRHIAQSASFGRDLGDRVKGNLVIVGYIEGCGFTRPQFVAVHLAVDQSGFYKVSLQAGDRLSVVPGADSQRGVIMEDRGFEGEIDRAALLSNSPRAIGHATGTLVFLDPTANHYVEFLFNFDAPVERR